MISKNNKEAYEPMTMTSVEVELQGVLCQSVVEGFQIESGTVVNAGGMF